jgi:hypothetical protein
LFDRAGVANVFGVVCGFSAFWEPESGGVVSAGCVFHPFGWWGDEGGEVVNAHCLCLCLFAMFANRHGSHITIW